MIKCKKGKTTFRGRGYEVRAELSTIIYALHREYAEVKDSETASTAIIKDVMAGIDQAVRDERRKHDL